MKKIPSWLQWLGRILMRLIGGRAGSCFLALLLASAAFGQDLPTLWSHIYHKSRLQIHQASATVTGTWMDASHGRTGDGCRHEADGDGHCFVRLDAGQEQFLNEKNMQNEDGNLVVEPICVYRVTQADAKAACKNFRQQISFPPIGSHVRITGSFVTDTQHGHNELHPISKIEILPAAGALPKQ